MLILGGVEGTKQMQLDVLLLQYLLLTVLNKSNTVEKLIKLEDNLSGQAS